MPGLIVAGAALCLAANIFFEARSENIAGQYAVALVTMNRAEHNPKNVCRVVYAKKQFSWTSKPDYQARHRESEAWQRAVRIAKTVMTAKVYDFTNGATFYHTKAVRPAWRHQLVRTKVIGSHIFYRIV